MASGTVTMPALKQATFTANEYVSSGTMYYIVLGKAVVFTGRYTFSADISQSIGGVFSNMPTPSAESQGNRYLDTIQGSSVNDVSADHYFRLPDSSSPAFSIKGAHTAGNTYTVSGLYFTS